MYFDLLSSYLRCYDVAVYVEFLKELFSIVHNCVCLSVTCTDCLLWKTTLMEVDGTLAEAHPELSGNENVKSSTINKARVYMQVNI